MVKLIPQALYDQPAMLATPSKTVAPTPEAVLDTLTAAKGEGWFYDLKYDGIRCLAYIDDGEVTLLNRNHVNINHRYPDLIEALLAVYPKDSLVLDGEIVVLTNGLPDFAGAHRRDAQSNEAAARRIMDLYPATFMAFDILFSHGDDLRGEPFSTRRALLKTQARKMDQRGGKHVQWARSEREGKAMWKFVQEMKLEGLIAKRADAVYRAGRGPSWLKLKVTHSLTALVCGWEPGKGARIGTVGNLVLCLLDDKGDFVNIGKVGSGFTDADLAMIYPMVTNPTAPLLVEVEYAEVSPAGQLRFPVYKGIRTDVALTDCTVAQQLKS